MRSFSTVGKPKNHRASAKAAAISSLGIPCSTIEKNPIPRAAAPSSLATRSNATRSPERKPERSMTGIAPIVVSVACMRPSFAPERARAFD
jgi:hypothetical protein